MDYTPLILSIKIAGIATCIVFLLGVSCARLISRNQFPGKRLLEALFLLPLVLPPTVVGFGLLFIFGKNGPIGRLLLQWFDYQIVFTWVGAVIAAVVVSFPLMYQSAAAAFLKYEKNLEHAALTMGASKWKVFWTISFPLAWPGLVAGFVLSFARALGEFGATLMVAGYIPNQTNTIPLTIYFAVESGNMQTALFWVIGIVIVGFTAILWLNWWSGRNILKLTKE
ncbi:molybdate ABC transporter permease subunit [Virgibacillus sp. AGTR]|uniref:molybdate ABC transporter permease subunit n=1 Tax=Virgibacillus TaxID=84406 RepID=UPI00042A6E2B|nr:MULTISPECIES: molybdate ABC transporter permease subunit [Bacillaceae]MCC2251550.1 molybdate ABC transporter permease subunit [Virgibacillus sp. AGTR]MDY7044746.1 molybdate ABC transporter permease subunit [Virgibacillus sp. M23]QRZ18982.1 molybdate ABC transporter permease subunit [Virgibacillus sp. AGTR]